MSYLPPIHIKHWAVWTDGLLESNLPDQDFFQETHKLLLRSARCSHLSKMALAISSQVIEKQSINYAIFCSQHGELQCALKLLEAISAQEMLSPTQFVNSVHNAAAGFFSIAHKMQENMNSIAAGEATFLMGMVEASAWLKLHPNDTVLLTIFDDQIPAAYNTLNISNDYQYAAAFLLDNNIKDKFVFSASLENKKSCVPSKRPIVLDFLKWIKENSFEKLTQHVGRQSVIWERQFS